MIGIVADDITGAGDIGIMYAKWGSVTHLYSFTDSGMELPQLERADVVVLDTNSRFDAPETAYAKVHAATLRLKHEGAKQFVNKTCSVFRGNIGAEFDAMLDALGLNFAVVVLGFPKNGRTTVDGIHYVNGKKLEESEFRRDPVHPMLRSDLAGILQEQTRRRVVTIGHEIIRRGMEALCEAINNERMLGGYVILDVVDQYSLRIIAQAARNEPVLCGSSALSEELAPLQLGGGSNGTQRDSHSVLQRDTGLLVAAGSLMPQTAAQIRHLAGLGTPVFELDTYAWVTQPKRREQLQRELVDALVNLMSTGRDVLFHTTFDPAGVERTKRAGAELGLTNTDVSKLVSSAVADITAAVLSATGQNRAVIAGGDTSAAVCERLGVSGLRVHREIAAGLPSCWTLTDPALLLVLKSGSFGLPHFFEQALAHLREP